MYFMKVDDWSLQNGLDWEVEYRREGLSHEFRSPLPWQCCGQ